jgi:hypothetical protein
VYVVVTLFVWGMTTRKKVYIFSMGTFCFLEYCRSVRLSLRMWNLRICRVFNTSSLSEKLFTEFSIHKSETELKYLLCFEAEDILTTIVSAFFVLHHPFPVSHSMLHAGMTHRSNLHSSVAKQALLLPFPKSWKLLFSDKCTHFLLYLTWLAFQGNSACIMSQ